MPITQDRFKLIIDASRTAINAYKGAMYELNTLLNAIENPHPDMPISIEDIVMKINSILVNSHIMTDAAEYATALEEYKYQTTAKNNERLKNYMRRKRMSLNGGAIDDYRKTRLKPRESDLVADDDGYVDTYIAPPKAPFGQSPIPEALRKLAAEGSKITMQDNSPISTYKMSAKDFKRNIELSENGEREIRIMLGQEEDTSGIPQDVNPFTGKREGES